MKKRIQSEVDYSNDKNILSFKRFRSRLHLLYIFFKQRDYLEKGLLLNFLLFFYLRSYGTFSFRDFSKDGRANYYFESAKALLHGHLNINPYFLGGWSGECLHYKDQCEGYYGVFPSLVRVPLAVILTKTHGSNTGFLIMAYGLYLVACNYIVRLISKTIDLKRISATGQLVLVVCIGFSPMLFMSIRGYMYEEAILWGVAMLFIAIALALKFYQAPKMKYFYLGALVSTAALQSRVLEGLTAFVCLSISGILMRTNFSSREKIIMLSSVLFGLSSLPILNLVKFGVISPSMLMSGGYQADPTRFEMLKKCGDFNITRLPFELGAYLFPTFSHWPSPAYTPHHYNILPGSLNLSNSCVENGEYFSPFTITYFLITIMAVFGLAQLLQHFSQFKFFFYMTVALLVNLLILCTFVGMTERYMADISPVFLYLSFFGILKLDASWKRALKFVLLFVVALQIFSSLSMTINFWNVWHDRPSRYLDLPFTKNST